MDEPSNSGNENGFLSPTIFGKKALALAFLAVALILSPRVAIPPPDDKQTFSTPAQTEKTAELFPVPDRLQPQIDYWTRLFTEYTSKDVLIHDDRYMEVVFEVLRFKRSVFPKHRTSRWRKAKAVRKKTAEMLTRMAPRWNDFNRMTPAEKKLRVLYNGVRENPRFPHREAGQRVRAQVGHADKFKDALVRSGLYIDRIRKILDAENVPADLACLPLVESSFNPHAASYVGAVGIWQFMLRTAKRYDLTVTAFIDERSNVEKSTVAAARLLSDNYKSLKSWPLAITAYNHGAGGVRNAVKKAGSRNIADIIDSYKTRRFGFSSRNFYAEFIAARNVYYNAKRYFGDIQFEPPLITTSVTIPDFVTIESLQRYCGLSPKTIRTLNPALQPIVFQPGGVIPKGYTLNIPKTDTDTFFNLYAMIPQPLKYDVTPVRLKHKVRKGETLSEIARMYGVSVSDFQRANNIRNPQRVLAGTRLIVPGAFDTPAGDPKRDTGAQPETEAAGRRHKIRPGETLSEIALKYNTTVQTFKRINGILNPAEIQAGQILKIPEG